MSAPHEAPIGTFRSTRRRAIGPWQVVRRIGRDPWSTAYLAERPLDDMSVTAAVHLIRGDPGSADGADRFWRACGKVASVEGGIRLLGSGVTPSGAAYLAIEHREGVPILRWCARRDASVRERIERFTAGCVRLVEAHARGIAHGDFTLDRMVVDADSEVQVTGLGVGYSATAWRAEEPPSPAADVAAIGGALHELLTGRAPDIDAHGLAVPPSRAVRDVETRIHLEGDLDAVVQRALRPAVAQPYPAAGALLEDLRRWLDGRPVLVAFRPGEMRRGIR